MTQNKHILDNGRLVLYGFDAPTGGFFWTEFHTDDEYEASGEEVCRMSDGLTLTELLRDLEREFFSTSLELKAKLVHQYTEDGTYPTPLQIKVGGMFGRDIIAMLEVVDADIMKNHLGID